MKEMYILTEWCIWSKRITQNHVLHKKKHQTMHDYLKCLRIIFCCKCKVCNVHFYFINKMWKSVYIRDSNFILWINNYSNWFKFSFCFLLFKWYKLLYRIEYWSSAMWGRGEGLIKIDWKENKQANKPNLK
jgi:hypothetical protein